MTKAFAGYFVSLRLSLHTLFRVYFLKSGFLMNLNKTNSSHFIYDWVYNLLTGWNIPENSAHYLSAFVLILVFVALLLGLQMLIRKVLLRFVTRFSEKSENQLDEHLISKVRKSKRLNYSFVI